jgi:ABC-type glycerol-3-phosphate transport system substrate-binding protein
MGGVDEFLYPTALSKNSSGNVVAIPYALGGPVFSMRKDIFEANGVPMPSTDYKVGWSWEEALDAVSKVHSDDIAGISLSSGKNSYTDYMVFIMMITGGGELFDSDLNVTLDSPENLAALEYYIDLLEYAPADSGEISWFESIDAFAAGRTATHMYWGRDLGHIYAENPELVDKIAAVPLPNNVGQSWTYVDFDNAYAIYGGTEHPEECEKWLDFMLRPDNAVKFLKTVPGHLLPVTHQQADALEAVEDIPEIAENPEIAKVLFEVPEYSHSIDFAAGALANWMETGTYEGGVRNPYAFTMTATSMLAEAVQRVFLNGEDAATVLTETHDALDAAVAESKAAVE